MTPPGRNTPPKPPSRLRVLVVEDEFLIAVLLDNMLTEFGHEVVGPISRMKNALHSARREAMDVAILDVNIDGQEVYPVAAALASRGIPFIFVTAYDDNRPHQQYPGRPILQKPFQQRDLQAVLGQLQA